MGGLPASDEAVAALLAGDGPVQAIRAVCADLVVGNIEVPPRIALDGGGYLVMPAWHHPSGTAMTKIVRVSAGGARISGIVTWTTEAAGTVVLGPARAFTAIRTAAVTAVAVELLAPASASRLVVFGAGDQACAHIDAIAGVRPISSVAIIGRSAARADAAVRATARRHPHLSVRRVDGGQALARADIVCCATTARTPLFDEGDVSEGAVVCAIGTHQRDASELPQALIDGAVRIVIDDRVAMTDAGELAGLAGDRVEVLAEVVARGLHHECGGRTVFKSVGAAGYDWAVARLLAQRLGVEWSAPWDQPASAAPAHTPRA